MVVGWFSVLFTHHVSLLYVHKWSIHYGLVPSMSSGLNISCQMRLWTAVLARWSLLFPFAIDSESWPLQMVFVRTKWATPWKRVFGEIMHFRIVTLTALAEVGRVGANGAGRSVRIASSHREVHRFSNRLRGFENAQGVCVAWAGPHEQHVNRCRNGEKKTLVWVIWMA